MAMKAEEALAIAKSYTKKSLEGQGALKGEDGVSPIISVNTSTADTYKLDITDKNGTITTPNLVGKQGERGEVGQTGADGETPTITENADNTEEVYKLDFTTKNGTFTTKNIKGKQGLEGVSPTVTTNPDNTTEDYRLNITTKGGSFTTPNLRGPQGEQGPIGESAVSAINPRGDYDVNAEPSYTKSDYITYTDGNTYVCKVDNPTNEPPIDGTVTDTYWQVIAFRGAQGIAGKDGEKGADGVTFTPSIDENGVLSFTNNGGLENPNPIDIKGDNGVTFTPSIDADGYLSFTNNGNLENPEPIKVLGKDGVDGKDGADGTTYIPSIGTVTTVESNADASAGVTVDEEAKEAVFHFELPKGEKGFSPIVETVESENGHTVNITDVEGVKSFEVLNGKDGVQIDDETASENTVWSSSKINSDLSYKTNFNVTSMTELGFTRDSYVSVKDFWNKLVSRFGTNGTIRFSWMDTNKAYLGTSNNNVLINGGMLIYTTYGKPAEWRDFSAIYVGSYNNVVFHIRCAMMDNNDANTIWSITSLLSPINDTKSSATSTYSSAMIDEKIATKLDKEYITGITDANDAIGENGVNIFGMSASSANIPLSRTGIIRSYTTISDNYIRVNQEYSTIDNSPQNGGTYKRYGSSDDGGVTYTWSNWNFVASIDDSTTALLKTWSSSKIAQQISNATAIKYDNVINPNATKETDWNLAQGESHIYGRLLQLDGHMGSKSSTFSFLLFVKANYDQPTTVYATQLAGLDDDRSNIAHTTYFELGVSSSGNLTIKNKSAVTASYRFI